MLICKLCGNDSLFSAKFYVTDVKHATTSKQFVIVQCQKCGILITTEKNSQVITTDYYPETYSAYLPDTSSNFNLIDKHIKCLPFKVVQGRLAWTMMVNINKTSTILDIGCGSGNQMKYIRHRYKPKKIEGLEISRRACKEVAKNRLKIYNCKLSQFKNKNKYSLVYMSHVIEHLHDPLIDIKRIHSLLADNGKLVVCTPNINSFEKVLFGKYWDGWDTPRHIYMFTPNSIKTLLMNNGFKDVKVYYEIYSLFGRSLDNFMNQKKLKINNKVFRIIKFSITKILQYLLPFLRYSGAIQVIATKR